MTAPVPFGLRATWWPVGFDLGFEERDAALWADHHWYESAPLPGADRPRPETVVRIVTSTNPERVARVRAAARTGPARPVAAYGRAEYFLQLAPTGLERGPTGDHHTRVLLANSPAERGHYVLAQDASGGWEVVLDGHGTATPPDKRLAAEIMRGRLAHHGGVELHAAAVGLPGDRAVALVGGSGAGKTTAALVLGSRGRLFSGDRITVLEADRAIRLAAYPDAVRLGFGAVRALGAEQRLLAHPLLRPQDFRTPGGEIEREAWQPGSRRKISLTRREVDEVLGVRVGSTGRLTDLIVLRRDPAAVDPRPVPVPASEVLAEVAAQRMNLRAEYAPWLVGAATGQDSGALRRFLERLRIWRLDWVPSVDGARALGRALLD
ncbi:hypothetical protein [Streptacidiphilus sp. P02-A3a]|uniref:hypothetical protein n=1 Tax=Streptacidiphilus sp. P02-A3a TaxID=2704468 RepID=UPI0015F7ABE6|nr:hypothetical protein [Streptacidiphilus sp. P02-A3a]QMU69772.1 hypothetical protein GXP74_17535 [Streptacidiphilus sp. P02-A3a]